MRDGQRYAGRVRAWVLDGDASTDEVAAAMSDRAHPMWGRVTDYSEEHNLVTNSGRERMTKVIVGEASGATHIALSTTAVTPALTDTVATITNRIYTQALTIAQSYLTYYQRYVAYYTTTSFGSTGIVTAALLDAASTAATTNLWADASISVSKSTTQSLIAEWQIAATT